MPASTVTWWLQGLYSSGTDFLPGSQGPGRIWNTLYGEAINGFYTNSFFDYSGSTNQAMLSKWRDLLKSNGTGAAQIIDLMWTDYAANYFTGTRSWLTPTEDLPPNLLTQQNKRRRDGGGGIAKPGGNQVPIQVYQRKIRYHWVYGIPAADSLVVTAIICTVVLTSILTKSSLACLRHFIYSLSAGRLLGAFLFPDEGDPKADTKTWIKQVGRKQVRLPDPYGTGEKIEKPDGGAGGGRYTLVGQKENANVTTTVAMALEEEED